MSDDIQLRTPSYRVSRPRGMDPATRRLALIAAVLGGALLVLIGVWSMSGGGGPASRGGLPVIAPPAGPLREKPAEPGGMHVAGANQPIFGRNGTAGPAGAAGVMAPPERPDLAALAPPPATSAGSSQIGGAPSAMPAPASPQTAAALPLPPLPPARLTAPAEISALGAAAAAPPEPRPLPEAAAPAGNTPAGKAQVQLAALPTRAAAEAEWTALRRKFPALLGSRRLILARARVGGHEWWRVRTAGFSDTKAARRFCARARAAGQACDVTPF